MKNVTISLSNNIVQVLDSICKDCNLSRYAFAKEALLEKIEKHTKNDSEKQEKEALENTVDSIHKEDHESDFPFF